ncbi:MAG: cyclopropane-fatty-acyl-phospholipid synthase family protein [Alphaproteobacteria bacterium]
MFLLSYFLRHLIGIGTLRVIDARGKLHEFSGTPGPAVTIRLHDRSLHRRLFLNPRLVAGEAYMDGTLTVEDATIYDFLALAGMNFAAAPRYLLSALYADSRGLMRWLHQFNPVRRARSNVAHHYDLSERLYALFLDAERQYSCAYFLEPDEGLDKAQANKMRHIAAKLLLKPGMRVLDIGSGWGGLALYLARATGAEVTGITLSEEQCKRAAGRAAEAGLSETVRFHVRDYREQEGVFDRIVSVGMFEHVGAPQFGTFFRQLRDRLAPDGVALLHSIGRSDEPGATNPWIRKYIFPGGYVPALSEVMAAVEASGLWVTDVEILRLHYADTLRQWRQRFLAHWDEAKRIYDERFCRMWEFYLAASEMAFRHEGLMVFQMQLARRQDAVPLTRDYVTDIERAQADEAIMAAE